MDKKEIFKKFIYSFIIFSFVLFVVSLIFIKLGAKIDTGTIIAVLPFVILFSRQGAEHIAKKDKVQHKNKFQSFLLNFSILFAIAFIIIFVFWLMYRTINLKYMYSPTVIFVIGVLRSLLREERKIVEGKNDILSTILRNTLEAVVVLIVLIAGILLFKVKAEPGFILFVLLDIVLFFTIFTLDDVGG